MRPIASLHRSNRGFTLIELLIVISIVGLLSTLAVIGLSSARTKGKSAAAQADLKQMVTAIGILAQDTGKWPNGCPVDAVSDPEVYLNTTQAGIALAPVVGDQGGGCAWTAQDIAKWRGPYLTKTTDAWGHGYYFDADYTPYQNCAGQTVGAPSPSVVSFGPNGTGPNTYDCDDIIASLR